MSKVVGIRSHFLLTPVSWFSPDICIYLNSQLTSKLHGGNMCEFHVLHSFLGLFSKTTPCLGNKNPDRKRGTQQEVIARRTGESRGYESAHSKENYGPAFRYILW